MSNPTETNETIDAAAAPAEAAARPASAERLASLNAKLAAGATGGKEGGRRFWRSFEELAETEEFQQWVEDEFPNRASLLQVDRRKFLTLGGAAFAMAGLTGCRILPQHKAIPYVRAPEDMVVGMPLTYTSTMVRGGYGLGIHVESREGRPIKIEGNPRHPASHGKADLWAQADILNLYDPDRAQDVRTNDEISSWDEFWPAFMTAAGKPGAGSGAGIALLTETVTSPTLISLIKNFQARFPGAKWYQYEPLNRDNIYAGTTAVFGRALSPVYAFDKAKIIVSLDSDFLLTDGNNSNVAYARGFGKGRRVRAASPTMSRLYTFESSYTITGASSDHRFPVKPSQIEAIARALHAAVAGGGAGAAPAGVDAKAFTTLVSDLTANRGAALVVPGDSASPAVHALAHAINASLGAVGATVTYIAPPEPNAGTQTAGLKTLVDAMTGGQVKTLLIVGGNPVYTAPSDYKFREALLALAGGKSGAFTAHLTSHLNETTLLCQWQLPQAHDLEAWGDARAFDGTASLVQPLIQPLYEGRSAIEFVSGLNDEPMHGYDIVANYWQTQGGAPKSGTAWASWWERALVSGVIPNTAAAPVAAAPAAGFSADALPAGNAAGGGKVEIAIRPDPSLYDGRYANNSWLQEVPKPITTIVWDNTAQISPATAKDLGIISGTSDSDARDIAQVTGKSVVTITTAGGAKINLPVWILPGQPDGVVTVHLGFGRTVCGNVGNGVGSDAYVLRTAASGFNLAGDVALAGQSYDVSTTQPHHTMRGINEDRNRDIIRAGTLDDFVAKKGRIVETEQEYSVPLAPGFSGHEGDKSKLPQTTNADGSLGGITRMDGDNSPDVKEVPADYYRREWNYKNVPSSNDAGWSSLYPEFSNKNFNAWAMGIDLSTCIGCNACVVACQAENNVPTVGKDQVGRGREMHWLRIDHYYESDDLNNVESHFQPVACVHCEKAPCEPVCPVAATIHSHEGLNQMVYNRCIGTRYCSNNCPYKVRRFNFLKWTAGIGGKDTVNYDLPVITMMANPEVTVRGRGVMEKCTYCVQRINRARIEAKKVGREILDGEVVTACQQTCPTDAIIFGDLNNPNSGPTQWRKEPHDYLLLSDLNTRPRTSYLSRIKNPSAAITGGAKYSPRVGEPAEAETAGAAG